jgi:hypothetical protein
VDFVAEDGVTTNTYYMYFKTLNNDVSSVKSNHTPGKHKNVEEKETLGKVQRKFETVKEGRST